MHIPDDPSFYEKFYFTPGDLGYKSFQTKFCKIGILICWDQWYPEAARLTALDGAEILFYPTAIGWAIGEGDEVCKNQHSMHGKQFSARMQLQMESQLYLLIALALKGNINFWGASFVANTLGEIIFEASHDKEEINIVEVDLNRSNTTRTHWPFLRDRRIDSYDGITKRFKDDE